MQLLNEFWALIPARSGSKGIKNKNIVKLGKYPLLAYSIKVALKIKKIKKVIVSTNSKKYIKISKKFGCKHFHLRSKKNSGDKSSEFSVFKEYILSEYNNKKKLPKYFVHFRPTTPIRKLSTISRGIQFFLRRQKNFSAMRSVSLMSEPAYRFFRVVNNKLCSLNKRDFYVDNYCRPRSYYTSTFKCNCIVDIYKTETILKNDLFGRKVLPFLTSDFVNDIDDKNDLKYIEYYMKKNNFKI
jgi:CMP-N,N'-diacetyllegionaminic acid synthase